MSCFALYVLYISREIRERLLRWFAALNFILFLYFLFSFSGPGGKRQIIMNVQTFFLHGESLAGSGHLWFLPLLFSHSLLFVHSSFIFNLFFSFCFPFFSPHLYQYLFWLLLLLFSSLIPRSSLLHRRRTEENFSFPSFSNLFYKLLVVSDPPFLSSSALLPTKLINVTSGRDVDWFITSAASLTAHSIIIDACLHAAYLLELKLFLKSKFPTRSRRPHSRAISRGKHIIARLLTLDSLSCLF